MKKADMRKECRTRTDYRSYPMSNQEKLQTAALFLIADATISWLFYDSWIALLVFLPLFLPLYRAVQRIKAEQRRKQLAYDFRDALNSLTISLRAGRSVEHAFPEAAEDMKSIKGTNRAITRELLWISGQLRMSVPIEELLLDLAGRSGIEDIENFAAVFAAAKRSGGNLADIIRRAAESIEGKIDVEREIETNLAAKRMEQRIMSVMPAGIILYMRLASPGYLDSMYGNLFGICIMSVSLMGYAGAVYWGMQIVRIEV